MKIAAYLDEVGETPVDSCDILSKLNIHDVVLRQVWTDNICNASDSVCQKLKKILIKYDIKAKYNKQMII